jgi:hypothetical protein
MTLLLAPSFINYSSFWVCSKLNFSNFDREFYREESITSITSNWLHRTYVFIVYLLCIVQINIIFINLIKLEKFLGRMEKLIGALEGTTCAILKHGGMSIGQQT